MASDDLPEKLNEILDEFELSVYEAATEVSEDLGEKWRTSYDRLSRYLKEAPPVWVTTVQMLEALGYEVRIVKTKRRRHFPK